MITNIYTCVCVCVCVCVCIYIYIYQQYIKQEHRNEELDISTIIFRDFRNPLSIMDRTTREEYKN